MSQISKRKRGSSDISDDYAPEKKFKTEETNVPDNEIEKENVEDDILSRIGSSNSPGPADSDCDTCTEASEPAELIDDHLRDACDEFGVLQSELNDSNEIDSVANPHSSPDISSESVIYSENVISSPVAGSLIETDFENDSDEEKDDIDVDVAPETTGKAVLFMGQVTPGSSICNFQFRNSKCSTCRDFQSDNENHELYSSESDCPVPQLPWACREEFWRVMCRKDELSLETRNAELFCFQLQLRPKMRVILLDWISEVAEYLKLRRETYYLCLDYIDRYLSKVINVPKSRLQLIGITCLFLACKIEEIEPPKVNKFAEVTDGACTEAEIFAMEVTILKYLNWSLSPVTITNWLEMLLQFIYQKLEKRKKNILIPNFSSTLYKRLCQLLNLVTLDITSLRFSYGVLVAAAIYILVGSHSAISSSGLRKEVLESCVQWMTVYWEVLRESHAAEMADVNNLLTDKSEIYFSDQRPELHTHNISLELYDKAQMQYEILAQKEISTISCRILTPPPSTSKSTICHNNRDSSC